MPTASLVTAGCVMQTRAEREFHGVYFKAQEAALLCVSWLYGWSTIQPHVILYARILVVLDVGYKAGENKEIPASSFIFWTTTSIFENSLWSSDSLSLLLIGNFALYLFFQRSSITLRHESILLSESFLKKIHNLMSTRRIYYTNTYVTNSFQHSLWEIETFLFLSSHTDRNL